MDRYSFLVQDFHLLLLTGLPAFQRQRQRQASGLAEASPVFSYDVAAPWRPPWCSRRMTNITWISIVKGR
jgi:hypothetical protein